jgi:hypothetical protein
MEDGPWNPPEGSLPYTLAQKVDTTWLDSVATLKATVRTLDATETSKLVYKNIRLTRNSLRIYIVPFTTQEVKEDNLVGSQRLFFYM